MVNSEGVMEEKIDSENLRNDLLYHFGAATALYPMAIIDYCKVENATDTELLEIAINNGFNLTEYKIIVKNKKY